MATEHAELALPADLFHLLCEELAARADYDTLSNCIASSKHIAKAGAIAALYRISLGERSPLKGGGSDNLSFPEQDLVVMRWSILWRTLILSALGGTLYPYCRHLRVLDLRDLSDLLDRMDEAKFKTKVAKHFFAGPLGRFHYTYQTTGKHRFVRLDIKRILLEVGDQLTQHAPLLESISEPSTSDVLSSALPLWASRLGHLLELELWDGKALADESLRNLLHVHCPKLNQLRMHHSSGEHSDQCIAAFVSGLPPDTLIAFENISLSQIGPETCLALNNHGRSLVSLKLALEEDGILALGLLQSCTRMRILEIAALRTSVDLKTTQNDVFVEIVEWLKQCDALTEVQFTSIISAPDLLLPVLLNSNVKLRSLAITAKEDLMYVVKDHHDFHRALGRQSSLHSLTLRAEPEPVTRDDMEILMNTFCSLVHLRDLNLHRISDYISDDHVALLARALPQLESFSVGGYGISDMALASVAQLRKLTTMTFAGLTRFTVDGILGFIEQLGAGNEGLVLSIEMAQPDSIISEEGQEILREAIAHKVNGRFEYQPLRDPDVPEFDGSDSE
ncbi:hypothetical protein BAUCODRAFT_95801 [Baudoinia panamericana UAMH 10762]|uniref:F-box domain-containing protein n=1 Tax=Baudoinia panamericana (strain UAMH 10762) TaxID=717646 RepID=M2M8E5_BAUPA|nr:uncharacterized protein BAUCODRAFT_95801 [Baudoinia panamericana UAMH 10762]EMC92646.1 hypothetical protein BAUCODRAFT_95801 [Baudoinia panamericana UAMH 10762]